MPAPQLTPDIEASVKAKYPRARKLEWDIDDEHIACIVRPPGLHEWRKFETLLSDRDTRPQAVEDLARLTCVWPEADQLEQFFAEYPGAMVNISNEASRLAGVSARAQGKKL
jgi:hypothetical protein